MIQRDYIMRMVEQLGQFLTKIIFNKKGENYEEAKVHVENALTSLIGFNENLLNALSENSIADLLGINNNKAIGGMKCIIAARLLKESANLKEIESNKNQETLPVYQKSLNLYLIGLLNEDIPGINPEEYNSEIKELEMKLGQSIQRESKEKLMKYYKMIRCKGKNHISVFISEEL